MNEKSKWHFVEKNRVRVSVESTNAEGDLIVFTKAAPENKWMERMWKEEVRHGFWKLVLTVTSHSFTEDKILHYTESVCINILVKV